MKRFTAMVLILMMLVSSAMAQSLFPALESNPQGEKELAASYSTIADVQPVETGVDVREDLPGHYQIYDNVSTENYYAYGTYLGELGYQLVEQMNMGDYVQLVLAKGDISFTAIYNPGACLLGEVYPYGVEYEKRDPLKGYTEVEANTTVNLGNNTKMSIEVVGWYNNQGVSRPGARVVMQNLTQSYALCTNLMNVKLHVFAGSNHFTFDVIDSGYIRSDGELGLGMLAPMEQETIVFVFDTYKDDIIAVDPDRLAWTFEAGNSKYVYTSYVK